ncbi:MAG TPA: GNAT family N-acetyltransferase [Gaiellaceae bacterium]|nr:GNAT family N-acetyltransferase [Gaiellaceae bacterium]
MSVETLAYEPSRRDEVFDLLARGRGHETDAREFDWWFDGNPVGPRTIALAEVDGALAGVLAASFYRAIVRGRETLVALPLWAVTDEAFRGRGIFQALNGEVERAARDAGATLELGFTNRLAGPIYIAKLGWQDVHRLRIWARPLLPRRTPSGDCVHMHNFVADQENAYLDLAPKLSNHFVRDAAYLNWRYADAPRAYTILTSTDGYAVVGRKRYKGVDTAYIADLVSPTFGGTRRLLRVCVRAARGARVLLALMPSVHARAYALSGFVPTPQTIRLIGHALEGELPIGNGAWHFTLGDTDYF